MTWFRGRRKLAATAPATMHSGSEPVNLDVLTKGNSEVENEVAAENLRSR